MAKKRRRWGSTTGICLLLQIAQGRQQIQSCHSSAWVNSQTRTRRSIVSPSGQSCGISSTPGLRGPRRYSANAAGIVRRSCDTRIRSSSAASRSTARSSILSSGWNRKSTAGRRRKRPRTIALSRSLSAWNLIFTKQTVVQRRTFSSLSIRPGGSGSADFRNSSHFSLSAVRYLSTLSGFAKQYVIAPYTFLMIAAQENPGEWFPARPVFEKPFSTNRS
jgi:hypothetical protein